MERGLSFSGTVFKGELVLSKIQKSVRIKTKVVNLTVPKGRGCLYNPPSSAGIRSPSRSPAGTSNQYIKPHLKRPVKGPTPTLSLYKIFNDLLYVLHTGIQWKQLRTRRNELYWSTVYKWHRRWSQDGSYHFLFEASSINLRQTGKLDLSILHGDGSNTVVKKGVTGSGILATSTRRESRS